MRSDSICRKEVNLLVENGKILLSSDIIFRIGQKYEILTILPITEGI